MINYCYHTHTYRCGHAVGTEEQYIKEAIKHGFKVIGFSDHVFIPDFRQPGIRGNIEELDDYINTINELKEKYKDQVEIHLGFECEYSDCLIDHYKYLLKEKGIEYLILGQHLFLNEDKSYKWIFSYKENPDEGLARYVDALTKGMASGLFKYVAHPDLFVKIYKKVTPFVEQQMRKICEAAEKYDVPLEINLGGLRSPNYKHDGMLNYANETFFKIASEYNVKVIIGVDAHTPLDFDPEISDYKTAERFIKEYHLNHIQKLDL